MPEISEISYISYISDTPIPYGYVYGSVSKPGPFQARSYGGSHFFNFQNKTLSPKIRLLFRQIQCFLALGPIKTAASSKVNMDETILSSNGCTMLPLCPKEFENLVRRPDSGLQFFSVHRMTTGSHRTGLKCYRFTGCLQVQLQFRCSRMPDPLCPPSFLTSHQ